MDQAPESAPLDPEPLRRQLGPVPLLVLKGQQGDGFGAGCNRAFDYLQQAGHTGWIWLLNPDTALPKGDEAQQLVEALRELLPQALVGTAVQDATGEIEPSAGWIDPPQSTWRYRLDGGRDHRPSSSVGFGCDMQRSPPPEATTCPPFSNSAQKTVAPVTA